MKTIVSHEDIQLVSEIVYDVLIEDRLINKDKSVLINSFEFASKVVPILPEIQWDKKDNEEEFKNHVKTLFRNQIKTDKM